MYALFVVILQIFLMHCEIFIVPVCFYVCMYVFKIVSRCCEESTEIAAAPRAATG